MVPVLPINHLGNKGGWTVIRKQAGTGVDTTVFTGCKDRLPNVKSGIKRLFWEVIEWWSHATYWANDADWLPKLHIEKNAFEESLPVGSAVAWPLVQGTLTSCTVWDSARWQLSALQFSKNLNLYYLIFPITPCLSPFYWSAKVMQLGMGLLLYTINVFNIWNCPHIKPVLCALWNTLWKYCMHMCSVASVVSYSLRPYGL